MSHLELLHDQSTRNLFARLPQTQCERVFSSDMCDIDPEFLGFVGIYERLSQIIPCHWTVIDLGCAYAPQAFFFEEHTKYVGVDLLTRIETRFAAANTEHHLSSISDFIYQCTDTFDREKTFAICSYIPPWGGDNMQMARCFFKNVFTFYPSISPLPPLVRMP